MIKTYKLKESIQEEKITHRAPQYIAKFDSSAGPLMATANFLNGKDFPGLGIVPPLRDFIANLVDAFPQRLTAKAYIWGGWKEGAKPKELGKINFEEVARWVTSLYPQRKYPAIAVGASNGALVHLYSALNIPWLPQNFLIPVRRPFLSIDEPKKDLEFGRKNAPAMLAANPDLQLHQGCDPCNDRLMLNRISYFRVKKLTLGESYRKFIINSLEENGVIFIINCTKTYKTTKVSDRHYFQFGGLGGARQEEFLQGSDRVKEFLQKYNPPKTVWDVPEPDTESPEAEWGYEPALTEDIKKLAVEKNYRIVELSFNEPDDISPFVADLYSWWNEMREIPEKRLYIENFILIEPWWVLTTGSIPFWTKFNTEASLKTIKEYLKDKEFDEIYLTLFSNGIEAIGFRPIEEWKELFEFAKNQGDFIGVDPKKFPANFSVFIRYYSELKKKITARYPIPEPLTLEQMKEFIEKNSGNYKIKFQTVC